MSSYSQEVSRILDDQERLKISKQIRTLLKKVYPQKLKSSNCLDVGCSSGVIAHALAKDMDSVIGIDVDKPAIAAAKLQFKNKNLQFKVMSGEDIKFKDDSFDIIVCNQTYQFVNNPKKMMSEIHRVLKKEGICLMSARNKFSLYEAQTNILLIHLLPNFLRNIVLNAINKKYYEAQYLNYFQLKKLFRSFETINMTIPILQSPKYYGFADLNKYNLIFKFTPIFILNLFMPLIPNYILILKK